MNFENMTPKEAGAEILDRYVQENDTDANIVAAIAAACQHFYKTGRKHEIEIYGKAIDPQSDVRQFMAAFGQAMPATPQWPDKDTMDLRVRLVAEEFCEWLRDSGYDHSLWIGWMAGSKHHRTVFESTACSEERSLPKSADALIDLLYVTIGSLLAMGIDMWPLWQAVQAANLAKAGGPVIDGKVRKPAGWQPPDIEGEMRKQGWEGEEL